MGQNTHNKLRDVAIGGDYIGGDQANYYITLYQESEREFVVTHNANIKPVSYFTGRETELQELRQRIEEGRKSVLVSGMGGIGKTHICRKLFEEYLNRHAGDEKEPFRHIGYIEYSGDMDSSLQNGLKFRQQDNPEQNQEAAWKELEHLASDGKLLLFVDNVDRPIGTDPGLQRLKGIPGAVVLTSRQASFSDEFEPYRIGFLDMEQCKEIYKKIRFKGSDGKMKPEEISDLEYIIEHLAGSHTITIELLAHLAHTKYWTVQELREKLKNRGFRLEFHKDGGLVNIQESYEALYDLSGLTEAEKNILEAFSVFPYIPLAAETCNKWLLADAGASEDDDILMGLYHKGWLQFDLNQESYALHPVFAQFIYEKCKPRMERHSWLIKACQNNQEMYESISVLEYQKYIPFVEGILEKIDMGRSEEQIGLIIYLGCLWAKMAECEKAEKLFEKALEICKDTLGEDHSKIYICYGNLANVYMEQKEYGKAEELYKKAIQILERTCGEEEPDIAIYYINMADIYKEREEYRKAEALYKKGLQILERTRGEEHPETAMGYDNLANMYARQGEYGKAEELCKKSLCIMEKLWGKKHQDTVKGYCNLAGIYTGQEEYRKAEKLYKEILKVLERTWGEGHPNTGRGYIDLAMIYETWGKYGKAEKLYRKSLKILERTRGKEHPDTAIIYNNLANLCEKRGEYKDVITYRLKAYKIFLLKFGKFHLFTKMARKNIEMLYFDIKPEGDFEQWLEKKMKE